MPAPDATQGKARLFTHDETLAHLDLCQAYTQAEFGPADAFQRDYLLLHRDAGVQLYHVYGDFSASTPRVTGLASCMFISHAMLLDMKAGTRKETELAPWTPDDGAAILWVAAVVGHLPGAAAKCLIAVRDDLLAHPYASRIDRIGAVCTGPQGYIMGRSFGLEADGAKYANGWLFLERGIRPGELEQIGHGLDAIWTMTKTRDALREGRRIWDAESGAPR